MRKIMMIPAALVVFGLSAQASAQVGVHGRITTRSDVKMSIEGALGTSNKKLELMAKDLGAPLTEVKQCYGELVKEHPDVVGRIEVELELREENKPAQVAVPAAVGPLKPIKRCIDKAFGKLVMPDVPRPAAAKVLLELTNTAAAAVADVRAREEEAARVDVTQRSDGAFEAQGQSIGGEVSYRVTSKSSSALVETVFTKIRDSLPGLFDCRRRASKLDSPEGDIVFRARLSPTGPADLTVLSSSVKNERAPICTTNAIKSSLAKAGKGTAEFTIHFSP